MNKFFLTWMISSVLFIFLSIGCESRPVSQGNDEAQISQGREVYLAYGCAVCHGANADGQGISAIRSTYPPTNFKDPKAYRHGTDQISIQHAIKFGIQEENSIMPAFKHITDEELEMLSQYLVSLQKEN